MWSAVWIDSSQTWVLDTAFFTEQCDLLVCPVEICLQSNPLVRAVGRPAMRIYSGILGQGDGVQHSGSNMPLPAFGKGNLGCFAATGRGTSTGCGGHHNMR